MQECLPSAESVDDSLNAEDLSGAINAFLGECTEIRRSIFVRRYWFFDTVSDIAKRYGFTQSKVKTTLYRMREDLRSFLKERGYNI